ncbi:MAG: carboxypeptidase regulatory-like domain-containing protein [Acidobacteriota bacterium]|nr:carboxypeptidase regulatory-like domain-containing protein [Acidobacteriota bacterium]
MRHALLALLTVLAMASPAWAQFETATVVGTARDSTGAVVPGAKVTLTNTATGVAAERTSDANGNYEFFTVRIGSYILTAEKPGFSIALVDNIQVTVGARQRVDLNMAVGQLTETVEVSARAVLLQTDSSDRSQVISAEQTKALPLNGREYSALALLSPGVRLSALNTGGFTPREGSFNVNGLRSTFNNFLIDGVDNNAYGTSNQGFSNQVMQPAPDAIGEFKVVTNNMSAEYGRSAGATINVAYASGTNTFRGSAWEFMRRTELNATGFFRPASGIKPDFDRDQYGGVIGGPIKKNKAFFFADFEIFDQLRGQAASTTIATLAQRTGVLAVDVRNPLTGETYAAGTPIPMTAFARKVLNDLPAPSTAGTANNLQILQQFTNRTPKAGGKVDVQISPRLSLFGRYGWRDADIFDQPNISGPSGGAGNARTYVNNKQFSSGLTYTPGGTSLFEARFGWSKTRAGKDPAALVAGEPRAEAAYGITGLPTDPRVAAGLPTQLITGFSDLGRQATNPQWQYPTVINPKINYTWLQGRHSLKTGYEYQRVLTEVQDVNPLYGRDSYAGQFSRPAGAAASNLYNLADFMFGLRSTYALSNLLVAELEQDMHFVYLQDDWRVSDRLTLNAGLRYEYATPWVEKNNILSNFDPATRTLVLAKDGSLEDRSTLTPDRNNFGPRIGLAFTPADRTVLRGGYGVSYVHFHRAGGANVLPINGPQVVNAVVVQTPAQAGFRTTQEGYPAGFTDPARFNPLAANITYMPKDYRSTSVQSWFASVQREVWSGALLDLAYVGNRSDGMLLFANFNQAAPNNAAGTIPLQQRRPIPEYADITYSFNGGKSRYHSFQTKFDWRIGTSMTFMSSLTLSQTKDNGAGSLENPNGNFPAPQDFRNLDADFGLSGYHQPYNSTTSFVVDLPIGRGRRYLGDANAVVDAILGGWQIAGINTVTPGERVTLTYTPSAAAQVSGIQQDFRGANNYRPNVNGDPLAPSGERTIDNWFNRANVVVPTDLSQPFGNAERNSVSGPLTWTVDLVTSKRFRMPWRNGNFELRGEFFNLLNRTNFRAPNGNRTAAAFGTIRSTYDPRIIQIGLKLSF